MLFYCEVDRHIQIQTHKDTKHWKYGDYLRQRSHGSQYRQYSESVYVNSNKNREKTSQRKTWNLNG